MGQGASTHVPSEVEETAGHVWVVVIITVFVCSSIFTVTLQTALTALVQVRGHIDTGAVLEEGLARLLQTAHFALIFQYRLAHWRRHLCVNIST